MQIDLANWFEIATALVVAICCAIKPCRSNVLLLIILFATLSVEFTAKYLNQQFSITHDLNYRIDKYTVYSFFNIVKFSGFSWFIYFLLKDVKHSRDYVVMSCLVFLFVVFNFFTGQGYFKYNNYSNVFGITLLISLILYKVRQFEGDGLPQRNRVAVYIYLFTLFLYYSINLPFFVFFERMLTENQTEAIKNYRLINDTANYFFYAGLSTATLLITFNHSSKALVEYSTA